MNQKKNGQPHAHGANQLHGQLVCKPRPHQPGVVQPKMAMSSQIKQPPVAPPVYRPQATPNAAQLKMAHGAMNRMPPAAPPAYRPQQAPRVLQAKSSPAPSSQAGQAPRLPVTPPVYRPEAKKIVQPKAVSQPRISPTAAPVYRPELQRVAQPKMASMAPASTPPKAPPVNRPQATPINAQSSQAAQRKLNVGTPSPNALQPDPNRSQGRQPLRRELTHVMQPRTGHVSNPLASHRVGVQMKAAANLPREVGLPPAAKATSVQGKFAQMGGMLHGTARGVVQLGRTLSKGGGTKKKKKKPVNTQYGSCTFNKGPLTVANPVFFDRPPSNSRSGQGDHVVSYSLITATVATNIKGKPLDEAGEALAETIEAAKQFVKTSTINSWWHTGADNLIKRLKAIDPGASESLAKVSLRSCINETLKLLNMMPGTAVKNKKSTKGHGEGGSKGGIYQAERDVANGKTVKGNLWVSVLNLFDGAADSSIMEDSAKLEDKLSWLMALFSRAAPTLYGLVESNDLTLIPDTDLGTAARNKFGLLKGIEVAGAIQSWIDS